MNRESVSDTRSTRPTLSGVPKQSRPRMLLKNFRVPAHVWDKVEARAVADQVNPSDVVRAAVIAYVEES